MKYTVDAISRSKDGAMEWLDSHEEGFPRTWNQEQADDERRGYVMYESDWEAPPIVGYEELVRDGFAKRLHDVVRGTQVRAHFVKIDRVAE